MSEVVGKNVRRLRQEQGFTQQELADLMALWGVTWSRPTVAQMESGRRPLSVDELLALGCSLHVGPHLMLYPMPGVGVAMGERVITAKELSNWLWDPDRSVRSFGRRSERRIWFESAEGADRLTDDEIERIAWEIEDDERRRFGPEPRQTPADMWRELLQQESEVDEP